MKRKNEKVPGFDEIIFENRNKEYGAYDLRKKYLPVTFWSVIASVSLFTGVIISFFLGSEKDAVASHPGVIVVVKFDTDIVDPNKLLPATPPAPKLEVKIDPYVAPIVVDKVDSNQKTMISNAMLENISVNRSVNDTIVPQRDPEPVVPEDPEPVYFATEMPIFPGGTEALIKFIGDNLKYPDKALEANIEGKVMVKFVVSSDGSVKRISVLKGVDPLLDEEAMRVISLLPKWKPGKNNGTPAPVWFSLPVTFRISRN